MSDRSPHLVETSVLVKGTLSRMDNSGLLAKDGWNEEGVDQELECTGNWEGRI